MNFDSCLRLVGVEAAARAWPRASAADRDSIVALHRVEARRVGQAKDRARRSSTRRNACSICSASPQISESNPVRPASNTPTTVQSRCAKRSVSPSPRRGSRCAIARPGDRSPTCRAGTCGPRRCAPAAAARGRSASTPRMTTLDGLPDLALGQVDEHDGLLRDELAPVLRRWRSPASVSTIAGLTGGRCRSAPRSASRGGSRSRCRLAGRDERLLAARPRASARSRTRTRRAPCRRPSAPW